MRTLILALAALLITSFANEAKAASDKDVGTVVNRMVQTTWKVRAKLLERKMYDDGSVRVVFVSRGKRYTFYFAVAKAAPAQNFLSVWVRPNGTYGQDQIETFTDFGPNGTVDFGIGGPTSGTDDDKKYFRVGGPADAGLPPKGEAHRDHWQALYDTAIADALRRLK